MPDYSRPGARPTPRSEFDRAEREREQDRRDRPDVRPPVPLVKLDPEEASSWPPGTPWLDLSVVLAEGDI